MTCFVGKNESGKTAFLRALHLLNPLNPIKGKTKFDAVIDYPAKDYGKYKLRKLTDPPVPVVTATFKLDSDEVATIDGAFGDGFVTSPTITTTRGYNHKNTYGIQVDESVAVTHLLKNVELLAEDNKKTSNIKNVAELLTFLSAIEEPLSSAQTLTTTIEAWRQHDLNLHIIDDYFAGWLPKFFYFDEYSTMPGRVAVETLRAKVAAQQPNSEGEKAFLAFLALGGADLDAVVSGVRTEALIRELKNDGIAITEEAMQFSSQNDGLGVKVRETQADPITWLRLVLFISCLLHGHRKHS